MCISPKGCATHTSALGFNIDIKDARHDYDSIDFRYKKIFDEFKAEHEKELALRAENEELLRKQVEMTEHQYRRFIKMRDQAAYRKKLEEDGAAARQLAVGQEGEMLPQNQADGQEPELLPHNQEDEPELEALPHNQEDGQEPVILARLGNLSLGEVISANGNDAPATSAPMSAAEEDDRAELPEHHENEVAPGKTEIVWGSGPAADPCLAGLLVAEAAVEGTAEQDADQSPQTPDQLHRKETKQAKKLRAAMSHAMVVTKAAQKIEEERKEKLATE